MPTPSNLARPVEKFQSPTRPQHTNRIIKNVSVCLLHCIPLLRAAENLIGLNSQQYGIGLQIILSVIQPLLVRRIRSCYPSKNRLYNFK